MESKFYMRLLIEKPLRIVVQFIADNCSSQELLYNAAHLSRSRDVTCERSVTSPGTNRTAAGAGALFILRGRRGGTHAAHTSTATTTTPTPVTSRTTRAQRPQVIPATAPRGRHRPCGTPSSLDRGPGESQHLPRGYPSHHKLTCNRERDKKTG